MNMRLPKILLAAVLSLSAATQSHALTANLGNVDNDTDSFGSVVGKGPFVDTWTFDLGGVSDISGAVFEFLIPTLSIDLTGPAGYSFSSSLSGLIDFSTYSFNALAPGNYTLTLSGIGLTKISTYGVTYKVTTAVPEADTWLMLIVGAGLIAFQLRRKQKALEMPGLAA